MYTSGTTAYPKGVMITYGNLYWKNMAHIIGWKLPIDDKFLCTAPLYHVGGMDDPPTSLLYLGETVFTLKRFDPIQILETIQKEKNNRNIFGPRHDKHAPPGAYL